MNELCILTGMSDGVERGRKCEGTGRARAGLARKAWRDSLFALVIQLDWKNMYGWSSSCCLLTYIYFKQLIIGNKFNIHYKSVEQIQQPAVHTMTDLAPIDKSILYSLSCSNIKPRFLLAFFYKNKGDCCSSGFLYFLTIIICNVVLFCSQECTMWAAQHAMCARWRYRPPQPARPPLPGWPSSPPSTRAFFRYVLL